MLDLQRSHVKWIDKLKKILKLFLFLLPICSQTKLKVGVKHLGIICRCLNSDVKINMAVIGWPFYEHTLAPWVRACSCVCLNLCVCAPKIIFSFLFLVKVFSAFVFGKLVQWIFAK